MLEHLLEPLVADLVVDQVQMLESAGEIVRYLLDGLIVDVGAVQL